MREKNKLIIYNTFNKPIKQFNANPKANTIYKIDNLLRRSDIRPGELRHYLHGCASQSLAEKLSVRSD